MPVIGGWLGGDPDPEVVVPDPGEPVVVEPADDIPATIDHVTEGLARLREQYRKPNIIALLTLFLQRYNALEAAFYAILVESVYNAEGVRLDMYGRIVRQARAGQDDDLYRRYIFARIATNRSFGTTEDLILVCRLILNDDTIKIRVETIGPAYVRVTLENGAVTDEIADVLITFLRLARGLAVRLVLETAIDDPAEMFTCQMACFLSGSHTAGLTVITPTGGATDVNAFPSSGYLTVAHGGGGAETHAYTRDGANFSLPSSSLAGTHAAGTIVVLTDSAGTDLSIGKGWGDSTDALVGGKLARATI